MDSKLAVETNEQWDKQQRQSSVVSLGEQPAQILRRMLGFLSEADQARFSGVNHAIRKDYLSYFNDRNRAYEGLLGKISENPTTLTEGQLEAFCWSSEQRASIFKAILSYYQNQTANEIMLISFLAIATKSYFFGCYLLKIELPLGDMIRQMQIALESERKDEISTTADAKSEERGLANHAKYLSRQEALLADEKSSTDNIRVAGNPSSLFHRPTIMPAAGSIPLLLEGTGF